MGPEQAVDDAMQRICAGSVSTHALREESDKFEGDDHGIDAKISIHALREESDAIDLLPNLTPEQFQSTPSARRATGRCRRSSTAARYFNPRPPRGERPPTRIPASTHTYFNPRPPRGGRHNDFGVLIFQVVFQSTPSARRATGAAEMQARAFAISIHALREEGD